jgi:ATP-dependent RNA helicase DeaD
VLRLANQYQRDPARVQTGRAGAAHADIEHVGHTVRPSDRLAALINLLLAEPEQRTLVFVRTRATASDLASELTQHGFSAGAMSGELDQRQRNAMLDAFRSGAVRIVVATDVAARGLDIDDVGQVVHFDLPTNAETFTHRSGRTGRAGNKGTSIALVPPNARQRFDQHLRRAGIVLLWRQLPSPASIRAAADARLAAAIESTRVEDPRLRELAAQLLDGADPADVVAALLSRVDHAGPCAPRDVREATPPRRTHATTAPRRPRSPGDHASHGKSDESFTPFHITWGARAGANPSRVLAMVCRRGGVRSQHIGRIHIGPRQSIVGVASHLADEFARAARKPDPRNPNVKIMPGA